MGIRWGYRNGQQREIDVAYLTLYQTTKFRLVQVESTRSRQNKCSLKLEICFEKDRKHCGKGENAGYQHFLLSHNVFRQLFSRGR